MLWTTENIFNIAKVKTNRVWMWWLTSVVQHSGKLKQKTAMSSRPAWTRQPFTAAKISLTAQSKPGMERSTWFYPKYVKHKNETQKPSCGHVGLWDGSVGNGITRVQFREPPCWKEKNDSCEHRWLWPAPRKCSTSQGRREPQWHLDGFHFSTHLLPVCSEYGWIPRWKGTAYLPAAYTPCLC